jgi:transposase
MCNAFPGPKSVIVLDNASVHHDAASFQHIRRACQMRGVLLCFLPPYSPDFNPIEESFGDLKAYIRRHYRRERRNFNTYQGFLEWAARKCGTGAGAAQRARGHFRNAGIQGVPAN